MTRILSPQSAANQKTHTPFEIKAGDLIVAMGTMRAWESTQRRGLEHFHSSVGQVVLVLASWTIGANTRLIVVIDGTVRVFSSRTDNLPLNWEHAQDHHERVDANKAWLPLFLTTRRSQETVTRSEPKSGPAIPSGNKT